MITRGKGILQSRQKKQGGVSKFALEGGPRPAWGECGVGGALTVKRRFRTGRTIGKARGVQWKELTKFVSQRTPAWGDDEPAPGKKKKGKKGGLRAKVGESARPSPPKRGGKARVIAYGAFPAKTRANGRPPSAFGSKDSRLEGGLFQGPHIQRKGITNHRIGFASRQQRGCLRGLECCRENFRARGGVEKKG